MPSPTGTSSVTSITSSSTYYINALLGPYKWTNNALTYSYPDYGSYWATGTYQVYGYGPSTGSGEPWSWSFSPLSSSDRSYFPSALAAWSNVSGLTFTIVTESSTNVGEIRAAYSWTSDTADSAAWAYFPVSAPFGGDIWFDAYNNSASSVWTQGSYAYLTIVHELGHALGLKHPFSGTSTLTGYADSQSYTVMSYAAYNSDETTSFSYYPTTPMLYDIAAIQYLYGANYSYNATDTTYTFADSETYHQTIWDGGGTDTIKYTGWRNTTIDLSSGEGSTIGVPVYVENQYGYNVTQVKNVWIAYGTTIENATGGSGNDTLKGNSASNLIYGGSGNDSIDGATGDDTLNGGGGNDTIYGGAGNDYLDWSPEDRYGNDILYGGAGDDYYAINSTSDIVVEYSGEGTDRVYVGTSYSLASLPYVEGLLAYSNSSAISLTGNNLDNIIRGGPENDTMTGGSGNDTFWLYSTNNGTDTITDFASGDQVSIFSAYITGKPTAGNGSSVGLGQVQYTSSSGYTTVYIGSDSTAGADITLYMQGVSGTNIGVKNGGIVFNVPPTLTTPSALSYTDTSSDNVFSSTSGYLYGYDSDSSGTLSYGIDGVTASYGISTRIGTYGTLTVSSSGYYTFTPSDTAIEGLKSAATESFTVSVSDGSATTTASLLVNLTGANDPTTFSGTLTGYVKEDTTLTTSGTIAAYDRDSGDAVIQTQSNTNGTYGTFSVSSAGTWSYTLNNDDNAVQALTGGATVTDSFQIATQGGSSQAVTITIAGNPEEGELIPLAASSPGKYYGGSSSELIIGSSLNDAINGGAGDDWISGGYGADKITGGLGADSFVFDTLAAGGADKIADFSVSQGDTFVFDTSVFTTLASGITSGNVVIGTKLKAWDANDFLILVTKGGKLYYDADGNGPEAAILVAGVKGSLSGISYENFSAV